MTIGKALGTTLGLILLVILRNLMTIYILYLIITPTCILPPPPPIAAIMHVEDARDYTLEIISITETVGLSDVEMIIRYSSNDTSFVIRLEDIIHENPSNRIKDISYLDSNDDNRLSAGDRILLIMDWDGPNHDGDGDGDFTNDGPFHKGDIIRLIHTRLYATICEHIIDY
jgi:hypothetical protein